MSIHENFEATKAPDAQQGTLANLSSYAMERSAPMQSRGDQHTNLVEKGILPTVSFMEMSNDVRTGTPPTAAEIKDSGVKVHRGQGGSTVSEYPNGVKIETLPAPASQTGSVRFGPTIGLSTEKPNHLDKKGEVVDPKGRVIARMNDDGSVTVDSGNGFFTQYPDGTVNRESAIRSRDGKNFAVLDTNTPLGDLRPSDMTRHK
jgi:hypothetical protein